MFCIIYYGLFESLRTIVSSIVSQNFVLCPRYSSNQPKFCEDKHELKCANFVDAFRENLCNKIRLLCLRIQVSMNDTTISIYGRHGLTKILAAREITSNT